MEDLLKRWAELEPAKCKPLDKSVYAVSIGRRWYLVHSSIRLLRERAYLQLAVQEAVEARGLSWDLWYHGDQHGASVHSRVARYPHEGDKISTAEAILFSYLKALEANL